MIPLKSTLLKIPSYAEMKGKDGKPVMNRDYGKGAFKAFRKIGKWFPIECQVEIEKLALKTFVDNNTKSELLLSILDKYQVPYSRLGGGTNRFGILIEEYAVKIALDSDGVIDNCIETLHSRYFYPDAIPIYELSGNYCIEVTKYGKICDLADFKRLEPQMREILQRLSDKYLIGDIGINVNNYVNWTVDDEGKPAMMDFAYIYPMAHIRLRCSCENTGNYLIPDGNFDKLICPACHKQWTFGQIRQRIPRERLLEIIKDIMNDIYVLKNTDEEQTIPINPRISPDRIKKDKKKKFKLEENQEYDPLEELLESYENL